MGLPEPREFSSLPRLRLIQAGIKRVHSERATVSDRVRLPITPAILCQLRDYWDTKAADQDIIMLWAASVLCFFGFFRSGEITIPTLQGFNSTRHLSWGDVSVDNSHSPKTLRVRLKRSKTDQLGAGVEVFVGKTGCRLCPVASVMAYMIVRGSEEGPFFKFKNGQPLTKARFTKDIRAGLEAVGLPYRSFAGHSFRSGAATAAAAAGIEDSTIRMMGRWSSAAFLAYIRTPRDQLAQFSTNLARR